MRLLLLAGVLLVASGCGVARKPGVLIDNKTGARYECDRLDADDANAYCSFGDPKNPTVVVLPRDYTIIRGKTADEVQK